MKSYDNHLSKDHFMSSRTVIPEFDGGEGVNSVNHETNAEEEGANANGGGDDEDSNGEEDFSNFNEGGIGPQTTSTLTLEEELKSAAVNWILKIKETCKLTQSSMDQIIQGVTDFNSFILSKLYGVVKNALEDHSINIDDLAQLAKAFNMDSPFFRPFQGVETYHQQLQYCKKNLGLIVSTYIYQYDIYNVQ